MASFPIAKLGDVCCFEREQGIHSELPYVGLEDVESGTGKFLGSKSPASVKSSTFRFSSEHVLYGRLRPYLNKVLLPDFEGHCSTEIFPIRPLPQLTREYLFYWLSMDSTAKAIDATSTGARMPRANMNAILDFEIPVPGLAMQRRIVATLDEAFEGIATAKANAEKNLQNARELGNHLRNGLFSRIAKIAKRRRLGEVCAFVRGPFGGSLKKANFVGDGYAVYEQSHAIYDQFSAIRYFIKESKFDEMRRFELRPNDLIMSCSGTMGRVAIAPPGLRRGIINQALLKLTPSISVNAEYLKHWMDSYDFQDALAKCSGGAAIQNVASVSVLKEIALPLPPLDDQQMVIDQIKRFTAEAERLHGCYERKLLALYELKKSLLHQAFTGQL